MEKELWLRQRIDLHVHGGLGIEEANYAIYQHMLR
jgi:hypothetical protein